LFSSRLSLQFPLLMVILTSWAATFLLFFFLPSNVFRLIHSL
jgi:hypothetical protein